MGADVPFGLLLTASNAHRRLRRIDGCEPSVFIDDGIRSEWARNGNLRPALPHGYIAFAVPK